MCLLLFKLKNQGYYHCLVFSRVTLKKLQGTGPVDSALIDTESAVMSTFDFLAGENAVDDDEENLR